MVVVALHSIFAWNVPPSSSSQIERKRDTVSSSHADGRTSPASLALRYQAQKPTNDHVCMSNGGRTTLMEYPLVPLADVLH